MGGTPILFVLIRFFRDGFYPPSDLRCRTDSPSLQGVCQLVGSIRGDGLELARNSAPPIGVRRGGSEERLRGARPGSPVPIQWRVLPHALACAGA